MSDHKDTLSLLGTSVFKNFSILGESVKVKSVMDLLARSLPDETFLDCTIEFDQQHNDIVISVKGQLHNP